MDIEKINMFNFFYHSVLTPENKLIQPDPRNLLKPPYLLELVSLDGPTVFEALISLAKTKAKGVDGNGQVIEVLCISKPMHCSQHVLPEERVNSGYISQLQIW